MPEFGTVEAAVVRGAGGGSHPTRRVLSTESIVGQTARHYSIPACSFTYLAASSWVANQTPPLAFM